MVPGHVLSWTDRFSHPPLRQLPQGGDPPGLRGPQQASCEWRQGALSHATGGGAQQFTSTLPGFVFGFYFLLNKQTHLRHPWEKQPAWDPEKSHSQWSLPQLQGQIDGPRVAWCAGLLWVWGHMAGRLAARCPAPQGRPVSGWPGAAGARGQEPGGVAAGE